ncbi:type IV toxin-antitoxin system AbiEi family antitoxin domain-containing protein [Microlunatus flavus]|nr:type IV toxin-antitoxin system AbiEi family antitoxin domain-containing protein [Microlunatus flavus]
MDLPGHLLRANGGVFSRAEVLALGENDRSLASAVRSGELVRLRQGAYVRAVDVGTQDERGRHLLLARAVLARQRGRVALAGPSAALLHGFSVWGHDLAKVHVVRLDRGAGRREAGVVHHLAAPGDVGLELCEGLLTVSARDAAWQTALASTLEAAVVALDSALHLRPELVGPLHELAERQQRHPHSRRARLALGLADGRAESPGESLTRMACYRHGIPRPELQHEVFGPDGRLIGRSDFSWEEFAHLGEFDGRIKYERLLKPGQSASAVVVGEKGREDDMRATGKGMSRFVWSEVQPGAAAPRMARLALELEQSHRLWVHVSRSPDRPGFVSARSRAN